MFIKVSFKIIFTITRKGKYRKVPLVYRVSTTEMEVFSTPFILILFIGLLLKTIIPYTLKCTYTFLGDNPEIVSL